MISKEKELNRGTGLLVVEVVMSNINGDPDTNNDPRTDGNGIGLVSPVSIHRKLRDMVASKGPHWKVFQKKHDLVEKNYGIFEMKDRDRPAIAKRIIEKNGPEEILAQYWDTRVFGCTFLDEKVDKKSVEFIRTGVLHFGCGESVLPLDIERLTLTNKSGVETGKDRGMAPNAYRVARHALYYIPFFVDPSRAAVTQCSQKDIILALELIPYVYSSSQSLLRTQIHVRHAWYAEHKSALGSCPDHRILEALKPTWKAQANPLKASLEDYVIPDRLPDELRDTVTLMDLMQQKPEKEPEKN